MKDVHIDFGTQLFSKLCSIENNVYIGAYCLIDRVTIKKGVMIASRVTISSKKFSEKEKNDIYSKNKKKEPLIDIGENTWIGEGAVIQSDIGKNCIVGSGSVIDQKVNNNTIVHGNPGKVRRVNA